MKFHLINLLIMTLFSLNVEAVPKRHYNIKKDIFIKDLDDICKDKTITKKDDATKLKSAKIQIENFILGHPDLPYYPFPILLPVSQKTNAFNIKWWNPTDAEKLNLKHSNSTIKNQIIIEKLDRQNSFEKMFKKINHKKSVIIN